jgi:hypothetical protein
VEGGVLDRVLRDRIRGTATVQLTLQIPSTIYAVQACRSPCVNCAQTRQGVSSHAFRSTRTCVYTCEHAHEHARAFVHAGTKASTRLVQAAPGGAHPKDNANNTFIGLRVLNATHNLACAPHRPRCRLPHRHAAWRGGPVHRLFRRICVRLCEACLGCRSCCGMLHAAPTARYFEFTDAVSDFHFRAPSFCELYDLTLDPSQAPRPQCVSCPTGLPPGLDPS